MDQMFKAITVHTNFANPHTQSFEEKAIEFFSERGAPTFNTCEFSKDTDRPLVAKLIIDLWNRVAVGSNRMGIDAFNDFLLELIKKVCPQAEQGGIFRARLSKSNQTPSMRRLPTMRRRAAAPSMLKAGSDVRSQLPEFWTPSMRRLSTIRRRAVAPSTSLKAGRDLRSQFPEFYEGVHVMHGQRGEGVITGFEEDKANYREGLVVKFDQPDRSGKTEHRYFAHSLHKLRVV